MLYEKRHNEELDLIVYGGEYSMNNKIVNQDQSKKDHIITITIGIILCVIGVILYVFEYEKINNEWSIDTYIHLTLYVLMIFLGIVFLLVNFVNEWIKNILFVLLGIGIMGVLTSPQIRLGIFLFIIVSLTYIFCMRFKNIFSTWVTFFVLGILFLISALLIIKHIPNVNILLLIYLTCSIFMLVYSTFGVKINRWFIYNLGNKEECEKYDDQQLKNQIYLLYLIFFIMINVFLYTGKTNNDAWNLVNNSFLTGLAILQVDMKKIVFFYTDKKESSIINKEE